MIMMTMKHHNDIKNAKSRGHIIHLVFLHTLKSFPNKLVHSFGLYEDPTGLIRFSLQYFGRS